MKHFEKKFSYAGSKKGGGSPPPPKPATLKPPKVGDFKVGSSFQFAETVDLISDGPIDGLCNKFGVRLDKTNLLQGVFLNDIPVESSSEPAKVRVTLDTFETSAYRVSTKISNWIDDITLANNKYLQNNNTLKTNYVEEFKEEKITREKRKIGRHSWGYIYSSKWIYKAGSWEPRTLKGVFNWGTSAPISYFTRYKSKHYVGDKQFASDFLNSINKGNIESYFTNQVKTSGGWFGTKTSGATIDLKKIYRNGGPDGFYDSYAMPIVLRTETQHGWESYTHDGVAGPRQLPQKFFDSKSPQRIENNGDLNSNVRVEYNATYSHIRNEVFRKFQQFYVDGASCTYPTYSSDGCVDDYTEGGEIIKNQSVCWRGAQQIREIFDNRDLNLFEYDYLVLKLKAMGVAIPDIIDEEFIISLVKNRHAETSEFYQIRKGYAGDAEKILVPPYIAFRIADQMDGYSASNVDDFVINGKIQPREIDFNIPGTLDYLWSGKAKNTTNLLIPELDAETGEWTGKVKGFYLNILQINKQSKTSAPLYYDKVLEKTQTFRRTKSYRRKTRTIYRTEYTTDNVQATVVGYDIAVGQIHAISLKTREIEFFDSIDGLGIYKMQSPEYKELTKFNYSNVLVEFRNGEGANKQEPLSFFRNIYIDQKVEKGLLGPFNASGTDRNQQALQNWTINTIYRYAGGGIRQRSLLIADGENTTYGYNRPTDSTIPAMRLDENNNEEWLVAQEEGSRDVRNSEGQKSFSEWNSYRKNFDEKAQPVTHVIYNPNVTQCYVTLIIEGLRDSLHRDQANPTSSDNVGTGVPGILNLRIEVGYIAESGTSNSGKFIRVYDRFFRIVSLIESASAIDIGNPDNKSSLVELNYVKEMYGDTDGEESTYRGGLGDPFSLPSAFYSDEYGEETLVRDRFIRITKLSTEGNSTLIFKAISVSKVTEMIPSTFNYPYSALVATKLDSRTLGSIPKRTFECRLKKVKIPSNYNPLNINGTDKRYWNNFEELQAAGRNASTQIYAGDWDGSFKYGWTDNPAWIIYDMLTNTRYGLGETLKDENINKWQLYKIGRFCDAVDQDGYFVGVSDATTRFGVEKGRREPRFTCNIMYERGTPIYQALNEVASIFRGLIYFSDSSVSFADDTIKNPIMTFSNDNVAAGVFDYSNLTREQQYNAVEVAFVDKDDGYRANIEYVENEEDIIERGLFKKTINALGCTSRMQARRLGLHALYQSNQENQGVQFTTSLQGILCRPGDLIIIEDELKSLTNNFGKVLNTDSSNNTIKINEKFDSNIFDSTITVYLPTGIQSNEDIEDILSIDRSRYQTFTMNSTESNFIAKKLNGDYIFDSYVEGFEDLTLGGTSNVEDLRPQYAFYTGQEDGIDHFLWYSTEYFGWVFSTGKAFTLDAQYNKYISAPSGETNNIPRHDLEWWEDSNNANAIWYRYVSGGNGRDVAESFDLHNSFGTLTETQGITIDDVKINEVSQIIEMDVSSVQDDDFGSTVTVDTNDPASVYLPLIPQGSIYRFKRTNTEDQVYKILSVRENDAFSYTIIGTKYESGKYDYIENSNPNFDINYNDPYLKESFEIEGAKYIKLENPRNVSWTISKEVDQNGYVTARINGNWSADTNAIGYRVIIRSSLDPNLRESVDLNTNSYEFRVAENNQYIISVTALGEIFNNQDTKVHYLDSEETTIFKSVTFIPEDQLSESTIIEDVTIS